jgi:hypothetical protein
MPLSEAENAILRALAEAAIPPGQILPGAGPTTLARLADALDGMAPAASWAYRWMLWTLETQTAARMGTRFSALPLGGRLRAMERLERAEATRLLLRGLLLPLKLAHFDDPGVYAALGCRFSVDPPRAERPHWREQISSAGDLGDGTTLECDAVVVGTGAGGAAVAHALAEHGHAVLMLEEGEHYTRSDFTGRSLEMMRKLYRKGGLTCSFGNTIIPIPIGKGVGGTTLINSGTCFRLPESTLTHWRDDLGLEEFTADLLNPYYARVERMLEVAPSSARALGKPAELIARGCDALGYRHQPLVRNAPGCDGQGLCCFGCPTDAKRSTNVSFVPAALERGAQLLTGFTVDRVLLEGERAVGVAGTADGGRVKLSVRANVVVLACGSLLTPAVLLRNGLANGSGEVGRNLSIHPASSAIALFDEETHAWNTVPQGYAIDEFHDEGILFEGSQAPLDITAAAMTSYGPSYVALMERFNHSLGFGFMVKDTSRGRVSLGRDGAPRITYWLNGRDLKTIQRAFGILARVFFAAGAREVYPTLAHFERLRSLGDVERMERARISARQVDITAYHPLGTCRMGRDPAASVVSTTNEAHDVLNLFICDGSAVPSSLGVNPQMTIMSLALRAADFIHRRLEGLSARAAA